MVQNRVSRRLICVALVTAGLSFARADDILFFGNSFTFGAAVPILQANGGVPKLVEAMARAEGRQVSVSSVTVGGVDLGYHLAQPVSATALGSKTWTWVVLQDYSTRPTRMGNIPQFLKDGATFSDRIAVHSPRAGILLYETWARPPGAFYHKPGGNLFSGPGDMMADLHRSYGALRAALAAANASRPVRVALVGTAFAACRNQYPDIPLDATDHHHSTAEGYYLAALVLCETLYHQSVEGAPVSFFNGALTVPPVEAKELQSLADQVVGSARR